MTGTMLDTDEGYENKFTDIQSDQTIVEMVDNATINVDVSADCTATAALGKPCASSVHDAAIAIDQPDINIVVDMQPIGDGIGFASIAFLIATIFIAYTIHQRR